MTSVGYKLFVNILVRTRREMLRVIKPTDEARQLLEMQDRRPFLRAYGDRFCDTIIYGGQLIAIVDYSRVSTSASSSSAGVGRRVLRDGGRECFREEANADAEGR